MRTTRRIRHTTVVAYLALFTALGGGAYAAATITGADIVDESIGSADIGGGAVGTTDLANNAVWGWKVADNSLNGNDIADGSIQSADLAPGAGGVSEIKVYEQVRESHSNYKFLTVECPAGWRVMSGGAEALGGDDPRLYRSIMNAEGTAWRAAADESFDSDYPWTLRVQVLCIKLAA